MSRLRPLIAAAAAVAIVAAPAAARPQPGAPVRALHPVSPADLQLSLALRQASSALRPANRGRGSGVGPPSAIAAGLVDCSDGHGNGPYFCGSIQVPTSPTDPTLGTRTIDFMYRPADVQPAAATTLFTDGPIQSSFSDLNVGKADFYTFVSTSWNAQIATRDVILVNIRGTGRDAPDCPLLQTEGNPMGEAVDQCAQLLGATRDYLTAGDGARDLEAVRAHLLGAGGKVDLVAMGHNTAAAEAYLARYPEHVRSAVLDDAIDVTAFGELDVRESTRILGLVCARSARCSRRIDNPVGELRWLARRVRRSPITGTTTLADGTPQRVALDEFSLIYGLVVGDGNQTLARGAGLPAAIRAFRHGDRAPLLRLVANAGIGTGFTGPVLTHPDAPAVEWSAAGFAAAWCNEWPEPYDPSADEATRHAQAAARLAAQPARLYGIFSHVAYTNWDECWRWPAAARVSRIHPAGAPFATVPVLVMSGDQNADHASALTRRVAARYPHATFVSIPRASQPSIAWSECAARIQATFLDTLATGDTTCRPDEGRVVLGIGVFPRRVADDSAARRAGRRDHSTRRDRRVAATAVHTLIDAVAQGFDVGAQSGPGLRGGRWSLTDHGDSVTFSLAGARFVRDVAVTGDWTLSFAGANPVSALTVRGRGTDRGRLAVDLPALFSLSAPTAHVTGSIGGRPVDLTVDLH